LKNARPSVNMKSNLVIHRGSLGRTARGALRLDLISFFDSSTFEILRIRPSSGPEVSVFFGMPCSLLVGPASAILSSIFDDFPWLARCSALLVVQTSRYLVPACFD